MYRSLDGARITDSMALLVRRIEERFPSSGLAQVASELHAIARAAKERAASFERPLVGLRLATTAAVVLVLVALGYGLLSTSTPEEPYALGRALELLDAGANLLFLIGGFLLFMVTFERRVRRNRVLRALHELRALAHVIDMHQLTKDPTRVLDGDATRTASSPRMDLTAFELTRYLDYCSELLAHVGKLGALYVQGFDDAAAVAASTDIEAMTTGLARKVWQKIMILQTEQVREA